MKKRIIITASVYAVLIALFLVGTFCDLSISKTLADLKSGNYFSKNFFANFIEAFGEIPTFLLLAAAITVVGTVIANRFDGYRVIIIIITQFVVFVVMAVCFNRTIESLGDIYNFKDSLDSSIIDEIIAVILGGIMIPIALFISNKLDDDKIAEFLYFSIVVIVVVGASFLFTQVVKSIFSRPRFRALQFKVGLDNYSPWYKPSNLDKVYTEGVLGEEGFKSFPSGHTSWACCLLLLSFLPKFFEVGKKTKICLVTIPAVYCVIVMFSRILAGAHFLTDVTFSAIFTAVLCEIVVFIVLLIKKKIDKKIDEEVLVK